MFSADTPDGGTGKIGKVPGTARISIKQKNQRLK